MSDDEVSYSVGYKKTPVSTRFKKGQSGNPKGRPKSAKNFNTAFDNELDTSIYVSENGKRKKIRKRDAIAKQQVNKAVNGDHKATTVVLNEARQREPDGDVSAASNVIERTEDLQVMENVIGRIQSATAPEPDATTARALLPDASVTPPNTPIDGDKQ